MGMAGMRVATRRHISTSKSASWSLLVLRRLFSSDSDPPLPISPVSYAPKPKPQPENQQQEQEQEQEDSTTTATATATTRVAPSRAEAMRRVRTFNWRTPEQEEDDRLADSVPFPTLIRLKNSQPREPLDLSDAIRQLKLDFNARRDSALSDPTLMPLKTETVEAHVRLGLDPKRSGKGVRGSFILPHGSGKVVKVAYFAEGKEAEDAKAAGVQIVGGAELVEQIASKKKLNFDKCFATTEMVLRMGKISKILRERGLWPDRKLGTVTNNVSEAMETIRKGQVEFKMDKTAIVHVGLGKVNYSDDELRENIGAFVSALILAKPVGLKKASKYAGYITTFNICSTMGPGLPVTIQSVSKAADQYSKLQLK